MKIERFEDIEGWQVARELTRKVYAVTNKPRFSKDYGLKDQIQRAATSIMHNVLLREVSTIICREPQ